VGATLIEYVLGRVLKPFFFFIVHPLSLHATHAHTHTHTPLWRGR